MSLLLFAACSGSGDTNGKSLNESGATTTIDSLSYYMGVSASGMYQQMAAQDTTLKEDAQRAAYLGAMNKAMNMLEGKSDAEIAGMMAGIQMAYQMRELDKAMDLKLNPKMFSLGMCYATNNDSIAQSPEVMQYLQTNMERIQKEKMDKDRKAAQQAMNALTKSGYKKVDESLYEKVIKQGDGAAIKTGDRLAVTIVAKDLKGTTLQSVPLPEEMVVGQTFGADSPLTKGIGRMKVGGQVQFAIPAVDMFNGRQKNMGFNDTDAVVFDVTIKEVLPAKQESKAQAVTPASAVQLKPQAAPAPAPKK